MAILVQEVKLGSSLTDIIHTGDEIMAVNGIDIAPSSVRCAELIKGFNLHFSNYAPNL